MFYFLQFLGLTSGELIFMTERKQRRDSGGEEAEERKQRRGSRGEEAEERKRRRVSGGEE